jgi:hypothetical protein
MYYSADGIQQGMEQVLQNINRLNRNLESIIAVSHIETNEPRLSITRYAGWQ